MIRLTNIKKDIFYIAIILSVIIFSKIGFVNNEKDLSTIPSFVDWNKSEPLKDDTVICEFKIISNFAYENKKNGGHKENRKIYYDTSEEDITLTFIDLDTERPKIKGNLATSPLSVIKNDEDSIILAEINGFGDLFTYTIFKKEKVATWQKAYKLIYNPYTMLSMGYCY